jgi:hypothetical protein
MIRLIVSLVLARRMFYLAAVGTLELVPANLKPCGGISLGEYEVLRAT